MDKQADVHRNTSKQTHTHSKSEKDRQADRQTEINSAWARASQVLNYRQLKVARTEKTREEEGKEKTEEGRVERESESSGQVVQTHSHRGTQRKREGGNKEREGERKREMVFSERRKILVKQTP